MPGTFGLVIGDGRDNARVAAVYRRPAAGTIPARTGS